MGHMGLLKVLSISCAGSLSDMRYIKAICLVIVPIFLLMKNTGPDQNASIAYYVIFSLDSAQVQ